MITDTSNGNGLLACGMADPNSSLDSMDALVFDIARYQDALSDGTASAADQLLIENSYLEYLMLHRADAYSFHRRVDPKLWVAGVDFILDRAQEVEERVDNNIGVLGDIDEATTQAILTNLALTKVGSALYPSWKPRAFQLMVRKGLQNSWLDMNRDFFGDPDDTHLEDRSPSGKVVLSTIASVGSVACVANAVLDAGVAVTPTEGEKQFQKSQAGMIHELDVMVFFALNSGKLRVATKNGGPDVMTATDWARPASFLEDVHGRKLDGIVYGAIHQPGKGGRHLGVFGIDCKMSAGENRVHEIVPQHGSKIPTVRVNRAAIGASDKDTENLSEKMLGIVETSVGLSEQIIRTQRLARGLALMGIRLPAALKETHPADIMKQDLMTTPDPVVLIN